MAIRTKPELRSDFADNNLQLINAEKLRGFVDSNKSFEVEEIDSTPATIADETDLVFFELGADVATLPSAASFKNRGIILQNRTSGFIDLQADGTDTIGLNFDPNILLQPSSVVWLQPNPALNGWAVGLDNRREIMLFAFDKDNILETNITTQGTPEVINCSLSQSAQDTSPFWSVSGAVATYTGKREILFEVEFNYSAVTDTNNNRECSFTIQKNQATVPQELDAKSCSYISNDECQSGTVKSIIKMQENETLTLMAANEDSTSDITVTQISLMIKELR